MCSGFFTPKFFEIFLKTLSYDLFCRTLDYSFALKSHY